MSKLIIPLWICCFLVFPKITPAEVVTYRDVTGVEVGWYDASYALVITLSDYQYAWGDLDFLNEDANRVAGALMEQGFEVVRVNNPDHHALTAEIQQFFDIYGQQRYSRLVVYIAGHGYTLGEMGYIVPVDTPLPQTDPTGFLATALEIKQLQHIANQAPANHVLCLIDGDLSPTRLDLNPGMVRPLSFTTSEPVRQFIISGSDHQNQWNRSMIADQFAKILYGKAGEIGKDGYLTGAEIGFYLQQRIALFSAGSQRLIFGQTGAGDVVFTTTPSLSYILATQRALMRNEFYLNLIDVTRTDDPYSWQLLTRRYMRQPLAPLKESEETRKKKAEQTGKSVFGEEYDF
ncbi:MAG: caspase family protein [Gemmatimonadetes bacterium]|nr:MAG: caspase family protein [Gemmatimonadota bacterium]